MIAPRAVLLLLACLALLPAGLAGCAVPEARPEPGRLRLALRVDVNSLDPAIAYDLNSWPLVRLVNQGLLDYDDGTRLVPWLAAALPTISVDGRTFTFRLRRDVRFASGRQVTAADFIYTLERLLEPATRSPGEGFFRGIEGAVEFQAARERDAAAQPGVDPGRRERRAAPRHVDGLRAPDPYTLQIHLRAPDLSFPNIMALPFTYVVPREEVERWGEEFYRHPAGTGPFVLTEWRRGARIRLDRSPRYWGKETPRLNAVEVLVGADELLQQMMFERGELDLLAEIADPVFPRVIRDPRWARLVESMPASATSYLAMNCELEPFTDLRVRRAMNHAIDRRRLLQVLNNRGVAANGVLPPPMPGYRSRPDPYPYDPEKARRLLAETGHPEGFTVALWLPADDTRVVRLTQAVQQDLARVGVRVELRAVASTIYGEAVGRRRNTPMAYASWYQDYPDPANFLDVLVRGDRIRDIHSNNKAFYANPAVDALLKRAAEATDPVRRLQWFREAEDRVIADAPWVFLFHPRLYMLRQPWLRGMRMHPVWPNRYERLWLEHPEGRA